MDNAKEYLETLTSSLKEQKLIPFAIWANELAKMAQEELDEPEELLEIPDAPEEEPIIEKKRPEAMEFRLHELDDEEVDLLVTAFQESYVKATGAAWSKHTFLGRARSWIFYGTVGENTGVIAVRPQRSGMFKLVAVAGNFRQILGGIKLMQDRLQGKPLWGMVSAELVPLTKRFGLIALHEYPGGPEVLQQLFKMIPRSVFGGYNAQVMPDGGIQVDIVDVGTAEKYLVVNKEYLQHIAQTAIFMMPMAVPLLKDFLSSVFIP